MDICQSSGQIANRVLFNIFHRRRSPLAALSILHRMHVSVYLVSGAKLTRKGLHVCGLYVYGPCCWMPFLICFALLIPLSVWQILIGYGTMTVGRRRRCSVARTVRSASTRSTAVARRPSGGPGSWRTDSTSGRSRWPRPSTALTWWAHTYRFFNLFFFLIKYMFCRFAFTGMWKWRVGQENCGG